MGSDKNTYIGLFIMGAILFGWMYWSQPSDKELARQKAVHDSVAMVQQQQEKTQKVNSHQPIANSRNNDTGTTATTTTTDTANHSNDSLTAIHRMQSDFGVLYPALKGTNNTYTLENDLLKATISTQGGKIESVELKKFKTSAGGPLIMFTADSNHFGLVLNAYSKLISTDSLYFSKVESSTDSKDSSVVVMQLNTSNPNKYIQFIYSLKAGTYLVQCSARVVGMQDVLASNTQDIALNWAMHAPSQEANVQNQQRASTVYYKFYQDEVDHLSPMKDDKKTLSSDVTWVSFKQQFFSSILIANTRFSSPSVDCQNNGNPKLVKNYAAEMYIPYNRSADESVGMSFYFGPNDYHLLKKYSEGNDLDLQGQINLGWGIFGWVNKFLVIPVFDFLSGFNLNYGIVILILTLVIKSLLFPIAFKTYVSSAKMRVLKPEIDEIGKKFPKTEDAMKKQQTTMALYKKAGVNPMAGCLPMLFQLPILYALFSFFPASIQLRQQHFLWATDLSTYDTIYNFKNGFSIPGYGDHISLFALLMTLSQYLYLSANQQLMGAGGGTDQMAKTMKWMMYITPIFFLSFLNKYSAGLSYYYFLANLITFGQTFLARKFINEDELHRKMQANKAKPVKVSKFQKRLEEMAKQQQAAKRR
jgi:YidC/Oxa1 family membrane protein insertase